MRAIQKITQNDNGHGRNYGKGPFLRLAFWPKIHFYSKKKHPRFAKRLIFICEKGTFSSHNFARSWPGLGVVFLGLKSRFLAQKSNFCHTTPNFVNDPFVALGETAHFQPSEQFFDFLFPSYGCFRKKHQPMRQKVFPCPTLGAPSASNSPSALSRPFELENFASICSVTVV